MDITQFKGCSSRAKVVLKKTSYPQHQKKPKKQQRKESHRKKRPSSTNGAINRVCSNGIRVEPKKNHFFIFFYRETGPTRRPDGQTESINQNITRAHTHKKKNTVGRSAGRRNGRNVQRPTGRNWAQRNRKTR